MRLGIDLTGGDKPADLSLFDAVMQTSKQVAPICSLYVFASQSVAVQFSAYLKERDPVLSKLVRLHRVAETIAMSDHPLGAIRRKKNSAMMIGMRMLKKQQLDGFISCGNTGALVASAALSLPKLPGITRPALLASLPTARGSLAVLDVGGNVSCKSFNLVQFALLGAAWQAVVGGIQQPRIGLLNIGSESKKGTAEVCQAYEQLKQLSQDHLGMQFVGNIEGRDIFNGLVDVLVTDGFTGNILLKTAEGVASFIFEKLAPAAQGSEAFLPTFRQMHNQFNYHEYPGAIVCGVEGTVIKLHGNASPKTWCNSILAAANLMQSQHILHMKSYLGGIAPS